MKHQRTASGRDDETKERELIMLKTTKERKNSFRV
jgi:hypothetical protein